MKKIAAILMTSALLIGSGLSAMAAVDTSDWKSDAADNVITFYKDYTGSATTYPAEELSFVSVPSEYNPDTTNLSVDNVTISAKEDNAVTIDLPEYTKVGVYEYTITENAGTSQGVTYGTDTAINISVLVTYDYENEKLVTQYGITNTGTTENPSKNDTITNTYNAGSLAVSKSVTGNLGDKNAEFHATVTFTSETGKTVTGTISYRDDGTDKTIAPADWSGSSASVSITLKDDETVTFTNIPEGVTYTVEETEANQNGYTTTYSYSDNEAKSIASGDSDTVKITNDKDTSINTGIDLGRTLPYILAAVAAGALIVIVAVRRRRFV